MAVQTFATLKANMSSTASGAVSVQDLHDVVDTLEDSTTQVILAKTANYTAVVADNRRKITFDSPISMTFTVPSGIPAGWEVTVAQLGLGTVTVGVINGTVLSKGNSYTTAGQYSVITLFCISNSGNLPILILTGDTSPGPVSVDGFSSGMSSGFL